MLLYRVHRDPNGSGKRFAYEIVAAHLWTLPGVQNCPKCFETWASSMAYPDVDLSAMVGEEHFRVRRPQSLYVVHRMREQVRPFVPEHAFLPPGTEFGPLVGHGKGSFGDFGWPSWPGVLLVKPEVAERLEREGVRGVGTRSARITYWGSEDPLFHEIVFTYEGRIAPDALPGRVAPACAACGHRTLPSGKRTPLDAESISGSADIFRGRDMPTCIYATQRFVDAVQRLGLTDVAFEPVAVHKARLTAAVHRL